MAKLVAVLLTAIIHLTGQVLAIYNSVTPQVDITMFPDLKTKHLSTDANDYLRFLGFEHHLGFVGGRNNLVVINMTASVQQRRMVSRNLTFFATNNTNKECSSLFENDPITTELVCRSTYVRALLRRPTDGSVLLCGIGAFEPRCWLCRDAVKKLLHKSSDLYDFQPTGYHLEEIATGKDLVPFEPDSNFTNFVSDGIVYSGIYESPEVNSQIFDPVIVARPLADLEPRASQQKNATATSPLPVQVIAESVSLTRPHFIGSFENGDFGYMLFNEKKTAQISQFCKKGPTTLGTSGSPVSASFHKAFLFCGFMPAGKAMKKSSQPLLNVENLFSSSAPFRFEQLADITPLSLGNEQYFYGAFNRQPGAPSSIGICLFDEKSIRQLFQTSPFVRFTRVGGVRQPVFPLGYAKESLNNRPNNCSAQFSDTEKVALHNFRVKYTYMYHLASMVSSAPVFYDTTVNYQLTSITADFHPQHSSWDHQLFVATSNGNLLRIAVSMGEAPSQITSQLISRTRIFSPVTPIMRLTTWPPNNRVTAVLAVAKDAIAINFVEYGNSCHLLDSSCECLAIGYPVCYWQRNICKPKTSLSDVSNMSLTCTSYRQLRVAAMTESSTQNATNDDIFAIPFSQTTIIIFGIAVAAVSLFIGVILTAFLCRSSLKRSADNKKVIPSNTTVYISNGAAAAPLIPKPVTVATTEVGTIMTPEASPSIRRAVKSKMIPSNYSTLSRRDNLQTSRRNLLTPRCRSLPLIPADDDDFQDYSTDEDFCDMPSPTCDTQASRLSPSNNSGVSSGKHSQATDPMPQTYGLQRSGLDKLTFSIPPSGQPHNRIAAPRM